LRKGTNDQIPVFVRQGKKLVPLKRRKEPNVPLWLYTKLKAAGVPSYKIGRGDSKARVAKYRSDPDKLAKDRERSRIGMANLRARRGQAGAKALIEADKEVLGKRKRRDYSTAEERNAEKDGSIFGRVEDYVD
jgi:hypothetical protein